MSWSASPPPGRARPWPRWPRAVRAASTRTSRARPRWSSHVDGPVQGDGAALAAALGGLVRVIRPPAPATADGALDWAQAVRRMLAVGRTARGAAIVMLNADLGRMTADWLRSWPAGLKDDVGLILPIYRRYRYDSKLTQALVMPLMRSLFGRQARPSTGRGVACSGRSRRRFPRSRPVWETNLGHHGLEFWMPAAAHRAGLTVGQAVLGPRTVAAASEPPAPLGRRWAAGRRALRAGGATEATGWRSGARSRW